MCFYTKVAHLGDFRTPIMKSRSLNEEWNGIPQILMDNPIASMVKWRTPALTVRRESDNTLKYITHPSLTNNVAFLVI